MKREVSWELRYNEVLEFVESNHRGPSRHHPEEHKMLNWMKFNRKCYNGGKMEGEKKEKFQKLIEKIHSFHRINQYI